jgi:heavy metal translocating P-type ATPase
VTRRDLTVALHPALTALVIVVGAGVLAAGLRATANTIWMAGLIGTALPVVLRTIATARRGHFATDLVATLAIVTAIALGEPFAGLIIVLMQTGGESLERRAARRASAAVEALEKAAPRLAHRVIDESVRDISVAEIRPGDTLLVRPGELIAADGTVLEGESELDTSRVTGEAIPRSAAAGEPVLSGMLNLHGSFRMRAVAAAKESQYERIVELVRRAQASKAPLQRMADRWAVWFTPFTLVVCAVVLAGGGGWRRVLAVLVVATPCPLILAAPVAIIGGIDRQARARVIVRHGGAMEQLARVTAAIFDKTGTLTIGRPRVTAIRAARSFDSRQLLALAAAVEQGSSHLLARVIGEHADATLTEVERRCAAGYREVAGSGVTASVDGVRVAVGSRSYMLADGISPGDIALFDDTASRLRSYVAVDGQIAGIIDYDDATRPEMPGMLSRLRSMGVQRTLLLSGDNEQAVRQVAREAGIDEAHGDLRPEDKEAIVRRVMREGEVVVMVGDGTNDAPALSAASVGMALAAHGGGISAEAADVILLADGLDLVPEAIAIARRTLRIARQSVGVGLALSGIAMLFAAMGHIPPVAGALLQEGIDIAVILNALRAAR